MAEFKETVIDHMSGEDWCGVSTGEKFVRNRLERLAENYPDEVECVSENEDGSVYYRLPFKWVRMVRPRDISESEKERLVAILRDARTFIREESEILSPDSEFDADLRENAEVE